MRNVFFALAILLPLLSHSQEERVVKVSEFLPPVEFSSDPGHRYSLMGNGYVKKHLKIKGGLFPNFETLQDNGLDDNNSFVVYTKQKVNELLKAQETRLIDSFKVILQNSLSKIPLDLLSQEMGKLIEQNLLLVLKAESDEQKGKIAKLVEQVAILKKQLEKQETKN